MAYQDTLSRQFGDATAAGLRTVSIRRSQVPHHMQDCE